MTIGRRGLGYAPLMLLASSLWAAPAVEPTLSGQTYRIDQPWKAQKG